MRFMELGGLFEQKKIEREWVCRKVNFKLCL